MSSPSIVRPPAPRQRSSRTRSLRSSRTNKLVIPSVNNKTVLAGRAFQHYAPKLWNALSDDLRAMMPYANRQQTPLNPPLDTHDSLSCSTTPVMTNPNVGLNVFKRHLKTFLFKTAFS